MGINKFGINKQDEDYRVANLRVKLHIVELRLDHQLVDRNERRRLNYKKKKYRRMLVGLDPRYATGIMGPGGIPEEKRGEFEVRQAVVKIKRLLDQTAN